MIARLYPVLIFIMVMFILSPMAVACTNPAGVEGEVIYNETHNVPQYCDGTNWIAMSGGDDYYVPNAIRMGYSPTAGSIYGGPDIYNGTQQKFTYSAWFRRETLASNQFIYFDTGQSYCGFEGLSDDFRCVLKNSSVTDIVFFDTTFAVDDNDWHHIIVSLDLSDVNNRHVYFDGAPASVNWTTYTVGEFIDGNNLEIGDRNTASDTRKYVGDLADIWIDDTYIDLSIAANLQKFIDSSGNPVFLGSDGSLPTGTPPAVFLTGDTATWHINKGSGSNFTVGNALETATTTPYTPRTQTVPSGLVGHWRLDETSGTTALDSSGNGNDGTMSGGLSAATNETGIIDTALFISDNPTGSVRKIRIDDVNGFPVGAGAEFSFSFWYNKSINLQTDYPILIGDDANGFNDDFRLTFDSDQRIEMSNEGSGVTTVTILPELLETGKWYLFTVVHGSSDVKLYLNEDQVGTRTTLISPAASTSLEFITSRASANGSRTASGLWDDVRLYNRAITSEEVAQIYAARDGIRYNSTVRIPEYFDGNKFIPMNAGFAEPTTDLVGHWKLDETTGTTAVDSSGNGNDATLISTSFDDYAIQGAVGGGLFLKDTDPSTTSGSERLDTPNLLDDTNDITASLWIKRNDASTNNIARIIVSNGGDDTLFIQSDTLRYVPTGAAAALVSAAIPKEVWVHVAVTYQTSNKEHKIYVNGSEEASNTDAGINFSTFLSDIALSSSGFDGGIDDIRLYNRILSATEITQLYQMGTPVGTVTALPQGCPNIGDVCDDGTIYAGLSPDGNVEMFTTIDDELNMTWNDGNTNYVLVGTSGNDGDGNTNAMVITDSDNVTVGFQTHNAAQYCYDLHSNGSDDWYLPALSEVDLMRTNIADVGGFVSAFYWSSEENNISTVFVRNIITAAGGILNKNTTANARCVRKGPAPRCANPYGLEGQMTYNATHDVVQYCDGARWIGIGK